MKTIHTAVTFLRSVAATVITPLLPSTPYSAQPDKCARTSRVQRPVDQIKTRENKQRAAAEAHYQATPHQGTGLIHSQMSVPVKADPTRMTPTARSECGEGSSQTD